VNSDVLLNKKFFSTSPSNSAQQTIFTAVSMLVYANAEPHCSLDTAREEL